MSIVTKLKYLEDYKEYSSLPLKTQVLFTRKGFLLNLLQNSPRTIVFLRDKFLKYFSYLRTTLGNQYRQDPLRLFNRTLATLPVDIDNNKVSIIQEALAVELQQLYAKESPPRLRRTQSLLRLSAPEIVHLRALRTEMLGSRALSHHLDNAFAQFLGNESLSEVIQALSAERVIGILQGYRLAKVHFIEEYTLSCSNPSLLSRVDKKIVKALTLLSSYK